MKIEHNIKGLEEFDGSDIIWAVGRIGKNHGQDQADTMWKELVGFAYKLPQVPDGLVWFAYNRCNNLRKPLQFASVDDYLFNHIHYKAVSYEEAYELCEKYAREDSIERMRMMITSRMDMQPMAWVITRGGQSDVFRAERIDDGGFSFKSCLCILDDDVQEDYRMAEAKRLLEATDRDIANGFVTTERIKELIQNKPNEELIEAMENSGMGRLADALRAMHAGENMMHECDCPAYPPDYDDSHDDEDDDDEDDDEPCDCQCDDCEWRGDCEDNVPMNEKPTKEGAPMDGMSDEEQEEDPDKYFNEAGVNGMMSTADVERFLKDYDNYLEMLYIALDGSKKAVILVPRFDYMEKLDTYSAMLFGQYTAMLTLWCRRNCYDYKILNVNYDELGMTNIRIMDIIRENRESLESTED